MTLKLSIWWIGLAVIFSQQIRDSQSQCGCSRGNNAPDVSGSQIKIDSPTRPDVQVGSSAFSVRENIEKHPYKKPLDNTVSIDQHTSTQAKDGAKVTTGVCQADHSFWVAIGLKEHVMMDDWKNNQQNSQNDRMSTLRKEHVKNSKGVYDYTGSRLRQFIQDPGVIDPVSLHADHFSSESGMNIDSKTILGLSKYSHVSSKYRGRKNILKK